MANRLPEFQREVQALEARLETLKRILPPEKEMPDLMRRVQYLAAQSSLGIRKFTPAPVAQREFYLEVPINIDIDGTYHNLGAFFDRISRMSRLVNVGNVKIKAQSNPRSSTTPSACRRWRRPTSTRPPPPQGGQAGGEMKGNGGRSPPSSRSSASPWGRRRGPLRRPAAEAATPGFGPHHVAGPGAAAHPPLDVELDTGGSLTTRRDGATPSSACRGQSPRTGDRRPASRAWRAS